MSIRRGLLEQMAGSASIIKGTFTAEVYNSIAFGKTLNRYMWLIEMTDASKTALLATGLNKNLSYALAGTYPIPSISNNAPSATNLCFRVNPSTSAYGSTNASSGSCTNTSITINGVDPVNGSSNVLYNGYTYNYIIAPID